MDEQIADFLKERKDKLSELYQWNFDTTIPQEKFNITLSGKTWLEKTTELKTLLCENIKNSNNSHELETIAVYFIKEWGGIKRFSKAREVVEQFKNISGTESTPDGFKPKFQSISSWSKWASLVCPKWACIYDARVAYSINGINFIKGGKHKIFPIPEGRNSRLNILDVSTLLLSIKIRNNDKGDPKTLRKNHFVEESSAYTEYLSILRGVSHKLWEDHEHIHEVEMLLFALADTDVYEEIFNAVKQASMTR